MKKDVENLQTKYQGFINQLYTDDGRLKPIDNKQAEILRKIFDTELANEKIEFNTLETLFEEQTDYQGDKLVSAQAKATVDIKSETAKQLSELETTQIALEKEFAKLNDNNTSQATIDEKMREILKLQLQKLEHIKQRDELNNLDQTIINDDENKIKQIQTELNTVNTTIETQIINNINSNN